MSKSDHTPILLHLHLPKTAGGSLNRIIYSQVASTDDPIEEENSIYRGVYHYSPLQRPVTLRKPVLDIHPDAIEILRTRNLKAIIGHFTFGIHQYLSGNSTYVTLLRNPVDRIISLYFHYTRKLGKQPEGKPSLAQFLSGFSLPAKGLQEMQLITDNDQTRRISGLESSSGKCTNAMLKAAKRNLKSHFSVVGVTDRFDETVVLLQREFGWSDSYRYWPAHVARARSEQTDVDEQTLDRIRELNEFDFALYEFAKALMIEQIARSGTDFERDLSIFRSERARLMKRARHEVPDAVEQVEAVRRRVERDSQL